MSAEESVGIDAKITTAALRGLDLGYDERIAKLESINETLAHRLDSEMNALLWMRAHCLAWAGAGTLDAVFAYLRDGSKAEQEQVGEQQAA